MFKRFRSFDDVEKRVEIFDSLFSRVFVEVWELLTVFKHHIFFVQKNLDGLERFRLRSAIALVKSFGHIFERGFVIWYGIRRIYKPSIIKIIRNREGDHRIPATEIF